MYYVPERLLLKCDSIPWAGLRDSEAAFHRLALFYRLKINYLVDLLITLQQV